MRPLLKISPLTQLQDARSSAAVGFDLIGFSLARGSERKMPVSLIWNIANWISGPGVVVEVNRASLPELEEVKSSLEISWAVLPVEEWSSELTAKAPGWILVCPAGFPPENMARLVAGKDPQGYPLRFEITIDEISELEIYRELLPWLLVHFSTVDLLEEHLRHAHQAPFGYSLGLEAEEEPGVLDYARIDDMLEVFLDRFPSEGYASPHRP